MINGGQCNIISIQRQIYTQSISLLIYLAILFYIGLGEHFLPEVAGLAVQFQHFALLLGIVQLDLLCPLIDPIQKELGGLFADPRFVTDFDVVRGGHGETVGLAHVGYGAEQEPAAAVEVQVGQFAAFGIFIEANGLVHLAVFDNLQVTDRVASG